MLYEIINMSDPYTIEAPDLEIAAVACLLLGSGQYALRPFEEGVEEVPLMLFGNAETWFGEHFAGRSVDDVVTGVIDTRAEALAACFESCLIGNASDRRDYESALRLIETEANRETFRAVRHEQRRSSMNDIGGRAYAMAKKLRVKDPAPVVAAPHQVFRG